MGVENKLQDFMQAVNFVGCVVDAAGELWPICLCWCEQMGEKKKSLIHVH